MVLVRHGLLLIVLSICTTAQTASNGTVRQSTSDVSPAPSQYWRKVDSGPFSILAPAGWEFRQLTGVDSFVGEFLGDGITLTFDFGRYSTELRHKKGPGYILVKKRIDGRDAKLISPRSPGSGVTGVYVSLGRHAALCVWGNNLTSEQQRLALNIFETIRFGGPMPASVVLPSLPPPAH